MTEMTDFQMTVSVCSVAAVALAAWAALSSARSAKRSAKAAERSAEAAETSVRISEELHAEAEPYLVAAIKEGTVEFPTADEVHLDCVVLNDSSRSNVLLGFWLEDADTGEKVSHGFQPPDFQPSDSQQTPYQLPLPVPIEPYGCFQPPRMVVRLRGVKEHPEKLKVILHDLHEKHYWYPLLGKPVLP